MGTLVQWINDSFRRRIAVVLSGLSLGLGAGILIISYFQVVGIIRGLASQRLRLMGQQLAPLLARGPQEVKTRVARVARDSALVRFVASKGETGHSMVARLLRQEFPPEDRIALAILDAEGVLLFGRQGDKVGGWIGPPPSVTDASPDSATIGPYFKLNDTTLYYETRAPIRQGEEVAGYLVRRQRNALTQSARAMVAVLLGEGTDFMVGSPATEVWTDLARIVPAPPRALKLGETTWYPWGDQKVLALAAPLAGTPLVQVVRVAEPTMLAPARQYLRRGMFIAGMVVLVGTVSGIALGRTLARPIQHVTSITEQIATAEDPSRVSEEAPGEVGRLAHAFNAMVDRVASSTRRLRDNEASYRAFVAHAPEGIWRVEFVPAAPVGLAPSVQVDSWYRLAPLAECNAALARMCGLEVTGEVMMVPLQQLFPREDPAVQRVLRDFVAGGYRATGGVELSLVQDESHRIFVNSLIGIVEGGGLRRIWGTRRDITIERLLDERLAQTDRMEAIGRLAGGIAHDFNNLLTAILGYAESLQERHGADPAAQEDVNEISRISLRASELTRQLLAFSRGQVLRPILIDLNAVVRSAEGLLRRVIGEDIDLRLQLAEALDAIEADPGQIERVLMNLVVNARDAMPDGGVLELRTAPAAIDKDHAGTRPGLSPGSYVTLAVSDSGVGMPPGVRERIFEPFFSTKPKGKGTGLGLSTVYGIVRQSGGDISVYSELGQGTTFRIYLPVKGKVAPGPEHVEGGPVTGLHTGGGGNETILVVEDEAPVREVTRRALAGVGYSVIVARDGKEALEIESRQSHPIDLVLTDMILPGMSGRDLAAELRRRRPEIRLIVMSGYTGDNYPAFEGLPVEVGYLEKPFSLVDLRTKVREVLDRPAA
ncbi:MAG: ATP-binding protein [Gemmatimonadales bacterium]